MPLHSQEHNHDILEYATMAARMLQEIGDATNAPYIKVVSGVSQLILNSIKVCEAYLAMVSLRLLHKTGQ